MGEREREREDVRLLMAKCSPRKMRFVGMVSHYNQPKTKTKTKTKGRSDQPHRSYLPPAIPALTQISDTTVVTLHRAHEKEKS